MSQLELFHRPPPRRFSIITTPHRSKLCHTWFPKLKKYFSFTSSAAIFGAAWAISTTSRAKHSWISKKRREKKIFQTYRSSGRNSTVLFASYLKTDRSDTGGPLKNHPKIPLSAGNDRDGTRYSPSSCWLLTPRLCVWVPPTRRWEHLFLPNPARDPFFVPTFFSHPTWSSDRSRLVAPRERNFSRANCGDDHHHHRSSVMISWERFFFLSLVVVFVSVCCSGLRIDF